MTFYMMFILKFVLIINREINTMFFSRFFFMCFIKITVVTVVTRQKSHGSHCSQDSHRNATPPLYKQSRAGHHAYVCLS